MLIYVYQFLDSLLFSVIVEMVVVLGLCFLFKKDKRIAIIAGLGTCLTIPYVWFVFPTLFWYSAGTAIYLAEGFAFLVEAILYKVIGKLSWRQVLLFSLLANVASYFLGKVF
jgi:hypothetical protein